MRIGQLADVPDGGARGFDPLGSGRDTLFVVRRGTALHAYVNRCPHLGTPLPWRRHAYLNAAGDHIVCAGHGALFDIDSGRCRLGPCLGQSLETAPLQLRKDGGLYLDRTAEKPARRIE